MSKILKALINASERAACIARSCTESSGDTLLVAEKGETDANIRFERDFKTIADVLAQECAKVEIASYLPELAEYVRGEECNEINGVTIAIQESQEETANLLSSLIPMPTANRMAKSVHSEINTICLDLPEMLTLDTDNLGVWIDPIDATAEFIAGVRGEANASHGLPCVTVLIGAYLRSSGEPVVGVINQPFYNGGKGRIIWGVNYEGVKKCYVGDREVDFGHNTILISGAEKPDIVEKIKNSGFEVISVPGAGHKLLKVALGEAAGYIVSKGTTFRWDTCGPHAILNARGGGLISYTTHKPIIYNDDSGLEPKEYCNSEGIIAYADNDTLQKILNTLS
ncbi:Inositol polyphosphate 1-phosphatase [Papilio xuthus]|uniref:Inositol polyphosphate 1-phosphatase n=1 Tax=Papilio xuthus TaxID=66420 RepID=A0A194PJT6_PAPXU|nr:Inositol polyphosphate 1-phosphatase [Papilio xuthus]